MTEKSFNYTRTLLFTLCVLVLSGLANSQEAAGRVVNIALYKEDYGLVTVCYDLVADGPKKITMVGNADGFELEIDAVSGDIGVMITPGEDKCIFWESLEDYPDGLVDYEVKLDLIVTDYEPIGEVKTPARKDALPDGHVKVSPSMGMRKQILSDSEMLKAIEGLAGEARKSKKDCERASDRYLKARASGNKSRMDRLFVLQDLECSDYMWNKRNLIDYVNRYEDRTGSKRARRYLKVLE